MKKKVGIMISALRFGGNATSAVNVAKCLSAKYDVTLIVHEKVDQIPFEGKLISLECPLKEGLIGKTITSIKRLVKLKKIVKINRFDYLFIILPISNILNYAKYGCKKIVSCRHFGDLQDHHWNYAMMTRTSDAMVFNSRAQMEYFKNKYPTLKEKCYTIYNILDIDKIERLKNEEIEDTIKQFMNNNKCLITTGRFADSKGLQNLLKAFMILSKKREDVRLIMLGDGELKNNIEKLIVDLKISDRVLLPGFKKNPFKYISKADIFVLPSFYEGFPNMLIEAMACGTPVIASDCPSGPAEIMKNNANDGNVKTEYGYLLKFITEEESSWDSSDIRSVHEDFARVIDEVLNDEKLAKGFVNNSYARITDFKADRIASNWERLLDMI